MRRGVFLVLNRLFLVVGLLGIAWLPQKIQNSNDRIFVNQLITDAQTFPEVKVRIAVTDDKGVPISGIAMKDFEVSENGKKETLLSLEEISAGVRVSLVLDLGKWINNKSLYEKLVKEDIREIALGFIESMHNNDEMEIIVVYDKTPKKILSFTSDKEKLRQAIYELNWDNREYSYGLEGIKLAAHDLLTTDKKLPRTVVFISSGVMLRDLGKTDEQKVVKQLLSQNIPVFAIYVPWRTSGDNESIRWIQWFAQNTNGIFTQWKIPGDEEEIQQILEYYRLQYQLIYRSSNGKDLDREVTVRYQNIYATAQYNIDPSWIAPGNVEIVVNDGESVWRKAESPKDDIAQIPMTEAPIKIFISGLGNRKIIETHFFVNGEEIEPVTQVSPDTFTVTWDLSSLTESGKHSVLLEFIAIDELGIISRGSTNVEISIISPLSLNPVCNTFSKLPKVGSGIGSACMRMGISWVTLILSLVVIGLSVALWYKRETVVEVGHDLSVRATNVVRRFTNRLQKMEPKAKLEVLRGIPDGARTELNIFGETKIGRSHEHANLILENSNVSRLHCILHEELNGGWALEDQDSANGTFINGKRIPPYTSVPLSDGDRIELAPVEYGGVEMIFHVLENSLESFFAEEESLGFEVEDPLTTVEGSSGGETRTTTRIDDTVDSFFGSDFNDEANQRY